MELSAETYKARDAYERQLGTLPGVVAIAVGKKIINGMITDEDAVVVLVVKKKELSQLKDYEIIPRTLGGVKTDVIESDEIFAFQTPDPRKRWRPALGGVSISHPKVTAGTLGVVVRDVQTGERLILSNNHVIANSNDAKIGDEIYQPGVYDGGTHFDNLSALERFILINFAPVDCPYAKKMVEILNVLLFLSVRKTRFSLATVLDGAMNTVDAAVAKPYIDAEVSKEILVIGTPKSEIVAPSIGLEVQKFGRTTEYTRDKIIGLDATVQVGYGGGKIAIFEHQIIAGPMSAGGDSGSLVLDMENHPVGLLFAGSDKVTILNEIGRVLDALNIEFY